MAYLEYGLHQGEGFIVITGEVGAGKTTLVRNLLRRDSVRHGERSADRQHPGGRGRPVAAGRVGLRNRPDPAGQADAAHAPGGPLPLPARRRAPRAADRRRGAESHRARGRGAADAVELPGRQPVAGAELPGRPARVPRDHAASGDAPAQAARDRLVPSRPARPARDAGLRRAPPAPRRLDRRPALRGRRVRADPRPHRRRATPNQHAVRSYAARHLPRRSSTRSVAAMSTKSRSS